MIDHFRSQALIDSVGGLGEQEGLEAAEHTLQDGHHHQGDTENLQCVETSLRDHLVDDHLNQQRVGQGEELNHEARSQHLGEHSAVALQSGPEPTGAEVLLRRRVGALHQQQLDALGKARLQLRSRQAHHAVLRRGKLQAALVAGHHKGEPPLPGNHRRNLKPGPR